jgi:hypothetical protein
MSEMTPQAKSLAAFSLSVLLLTGFLDRLAVAAYVATGADASGGQTGQLVLGLLNIVLAAGVLWLAHTATQTGGPGWETGLAQAARLLAVIGVAIAVLATIAVLTNNNYHLYGPISLF